ncbi:MAG: efflux RND transporter permease subunit [Desulfomonilaceae bacterium]|nr:efflux RND transporter permease subunit [Desulfomonilaceae bacterium]
MFVDLIIQRRRLLVLVVILLSAALTPLVLGLQLDRTLKSAYVTSSEAYGIYEEFLDVFGNDEFVLVALRNDDGVENPLFLEALRGITTKLEAFEEIDQVISLSNLKVFRERKGIFGNYPLLDQRTEQERLPDRGSLGTIRKALPVMDFLLSKDLKSAGIVVLLRDDWRFHPEMGKLLERISHTATQSAPRGSDVRLVGAPVLREAVQQLTVRTALTFGILCALVIAVVSMYIFKSLRTALITMVIVGLAVYWVMGVMSLLGIPLNATTSLSFGLVLVVSVATVIHIVSHYYEEAESVEDKVEAVRASLAIVGRPCLMCSLTTSVAFATIMVSTIPMVQQLGLVMSLGVLISFVLAMTLTPAFLIVMRPIPGRTHERMAGDLVARVFKRISVVVFRHYVLCAVSGIIFCIVMIAGAPFIRIDTQILRLFVDSSRELGDIRLVEKNLTPVRTLELTVQMEEGAFKRHETWKKIAQLEQRLVEIPEVYSVDSVLPLIEYLNTLLAEPGADREAIYEKKGLVAQLLAVITFSADGKQLLRRYLDGRYGRIHISIRTWSTDPMPVGKIIEKIGTTASRVMGDSAKVSVTGEQAVFAAQASDVVRSQVLSLILALSGITLLIMIQLRSWVLGVLSIFPNLPPVAVIIGLMGWLRIPLDNVTVFAVAIAIGLAVDDTIHYLTQLKRDIARAGSTNKTITEILESSYEQTGKTLIATSSTLFFGFLMLSATPTLPAIYFGFLGASAIIVALWGDLVFLPSVILTFSPIRRLLERELAAGAAADTKPTEAVS